MKNYRQIRKALFANSSIDKIICRDCKSPNARFMNASKRGTFTVDRTGRVIFSIDPLVKEGSQLSKLNDIYIENNWMGDCPECEDEATVYVRYADGTLDDDYPINVLRALKKMGFNVSESDMKEIRKAKDWALNRGNRNEKL